MQSRPLLAWLALGAVAVVFLLWSLPRVIPFEPPSWEISRNDAENTALELARDLGELPDPPWVAINRVTDEALLLRCSPAHEPVPSGLVRASESNPCWKDPRIHGSPFCYRKVL